MGWRQPFSFCKFSRMKKRRLLFVDTNKWLDFYRSQSDAGLRLLKHLEQLAPNIITTYQQEMEFKKNRQRVILKSISELKPPQRISHPGLYSDAKATSAIRTSQERMARALKKLTSQFERALLKPTTDDPVYKICQRIFHRTDPLVLSRNDKRRRSIRNRALRRFLMGCPPRKEGDTSMGDAFNWEWMIECATAENTNLVIVSRDSDYGAIHGNVAYINDHLKQEFYERVKKKKVTLYHRLSDALREFKVEVTDTEVNEENAIVKRATAEPLATNNTVTASNVAATRPVSEILDLFFRELAARTEKKQAEDGPQLTK
jgi:hypothetical protein